ncbi:MAG: hypothetical protein U1D30_23355 [Planctomycetota bacterium]
MPELRIRCPNCRKNLKILNLRDSRRWLRCPLCDGVIQLDAARRVIAGPTDADDIPLAPSPRTSRTTPPSWQYELVEDEFGQESSGDDLALDSAWTIFRVLLGIPFAFLVFDGIWNLHETLSLMMDHRVALFFRLCRLGLNVGFLLVASGGAAACFNLGRDEGIKGYAWSASIWGLLLLFLTSSCGIGYASANQSMDKFREVATYRSIWGEIRLAGSKSDVPDLLPPMAGEGTSVESRASAQASVKIVFGCFIDQKGRMDGRGGTMLRLDFCVDYEQLHSLPPGKYYWVVAGRDGTVRPPRGKR